MTNHHDERLFRLLVNRVKDYAIFMIDPDGRIMTWNDGAECLKGYTAEQILGQSWRVFYPEEARRDRIPERLLEKARSEGRVEDKGWRVRKDGSRFWADVVITAIRTDDQELIGFAKVTRDLTERRASELAIQKLNETLEDQVRQRTKELQALAAELSRTEIRERRRLATELHDGLGQTLALANMYVAMLEKKGSSTWLSQVKELLDQALTYTRTLISDLRPPLLGDADDLSSAIRWVVKKVERLGLRVGIHDDGEPKPIAEEVLTVVYQSIQELLINVLKHSQKTDATLSFRCKGAYLEVVVQDQGVGFDVLAIRNPSDKGAFGLFNMRERLSSIGGDLDLTSIASQGTSAKVIVPLKRGASPVKEPQTVSESRSSDRRSPPRGGRAIRVLLVDDHAVMREGLRRILEEQEDIEVVGEADDGEMAVEMTRHCKPDVVIMDVNMPRINGADATRMITAEFSNTVVIALSMYEDRNVERAMRQAGAIGYLTKGGAPDLVGEDIRLCYAMMNKRHSSDAQNNYTDV